jgi:hypothetical protein
VSVEESVELFGECVGGNEDEEHLLWLKGLKKDVPNCPEARPRPKWQKWKYLKPEE